MSIAVFHGSIHSNRHDVPFAKLCSINAAPEFFCRWSDALARGTDLSCPAAADGRLLDQSGIKKPLIFGALFTNLAVVLMYAFSSHLSMWSLTIFYAVYMVGFGFLFNNVMTYGLQHLKPQLVGDGNALFSTLQQYAGSIGTACVSTILAITAAQMPHQSTVVQTAMGTKYSYILFIIGALIMDVLIVDIWKQIGKEKHSFELLDQDK